MLLFSEILNLLLRDEVLDQTSLSTQRLLTAPSLKQCVPCKVAVFLAAGGLPLAFFATAQFV